jgi:hypothetical protein
MLAGAQGLVPPVATHDHYRALARSAAMAGPSPVADSTPIPRPVATQPMRPAGSGSVSAAFRPPMAIRQSKKPSYRCSHEKCCCFIPEKTTHLKQGAVRDQIMGYELTMMVPVALRRKLPCLAAGRACARVCEDRDDAMTDGSIHSAASLSCYFRPTEHQLTT